MEIRSPSSVCTKRLGFLFHCLEQVIWFINSKYSPNSWLINSLLHDTNMKNMPVYFRVKGFTLASTIDLGLLITKVKSGAKTKPSWRPECRPVPSSYLGHLQKHYEYYLPDINFAILSINFQLHLSKRCMLPDELAMAYIC